MCGRMWVVHVTFTAPQQQSVLQSTLELAASFKTKLLKKIKEKVCTTIPNLKLRVGKGSNPPCTKETPHTNRGVGL